jgi:hypothetical protein
MTGVIFGSNLLSRHEGFLFASQVINGSVRSDQKDANIYVGALSLD